MQKSTSRETLKNFSIVTSRKNSKSTKFSCKQSSKSESHSAAQYELQTQEYLCHLGEELDARYDQLLQLEKEVLFDYHQAASKEEHDRFLKKLDIIRQEMTNILYQLDKGV